MIDAGCNGYTYK